jgi:hypothetical protein
MKDLEREYPALKKDRQYRETKTKNRKYMMILIAAVIGIMIRIFFY